MRLNKLEIKGFKSFADKATVVFDSNITGIVGPNGCGKSNIIDSIRWVLGEQKTSQLRLDKMDNVLFNGTKTRNSTSMAEVSLTFDNTKNLLSSEFNEVKITRRLYRSGESEYLINNVSCRLKDISNLFMDSGVSSDSYAIIELGMVDDILSNKDNSRKKLFEQAASISKYKHSKKESLSKLKSTEEDLLRLDDVLEEISKNATTLKSQASKAEKYNSLKLEYKDLYLESVKSDLKDYKINFNALTTEKKKIEDSKFELIKKMSNIDALIQKLKIELVEKEKALVKIQKEYNEKLSSINKEQNQFNLINEEISNFAKNKEIHLTQIGDLNKEIIEFNTKITELKTEKNKIETNKLALNNSLKDKQNTLQSLDIKFKNSKSVQETDKLKYKSMSEAISKVEKQIVQLNTQIISSKTQLDRLNLEEEITKTDIASLKPDILKYQDHKIELPKTSRPDNTTALLDIVSAEENYKPIIEYIFANVYLIGSLDNISKSPILDHNTTITNLKGDIVLKSNYIVGGSSSLFDGAGVGRKQNLDNLTQEIQEIETKIYDLVKEEEKINNEISILKEKRDMLNLEEIQKEKNTLQSKLSNLSFQLDNYTKKDSQISTQIEELTKTIKSNQDELLKTQTKNQQEIKEFDVFKLKIEQNDSIFQEFLNQYNQAKTNYTQENLKFQNFEFLLKQNSDQIDFYTNKLDKSSDKVKELSDKISQLDATITKKSNELKALKDNLLKSNNIQVSNSSEIEEAEKTYHALRDNLSKLENDSRELYSQNNNTLGLLSNIESQINEKKLNLQSIKERLKIEFDIEFDEVFNSDLSTTKSKDELNTQLEILSKKLSSYGNINPLAIEAYQEVKQRYDFLNSQKQDILNSKNDLLNTIKEIDSTAKIRFLESFDLIRTNFIDTFRVLFTEDDDCDLVLVNPSDPLESDIDIIAKPKGKKPLSINQLSGGEKTLTATALLFSLYLLKPAPFCIFDEVDAPLDDTNISKFNNIIQRFSTNSQFIIVTHNKETMSYVDALYGVTMQEQGISKLVPVKFGDL
ncbi:unnamed protein product [Cyprideis torosa]|uniref:Uncharacterized protein n=1 Tax=Cyprideis torosa TaxID=163714 RepID=A0A7R8ZR35_9CRUS|nr:unnamed protein product [Cyprideis torosa]CAG0904286.1 unnamed protein product [Cyprideis torosa]